MGCILSTILQEKECNCTKQPNYKVAVSLHKYDELGNVLCNQCNNRKYCQCLNSEYSAGYNKYRLYWKSCFLTKKNNVNVK